MITCADCNARIDERAWEFKREAWARLHPEVPAERVPAPRRCSDCALVRLLAFAFDEEGPAE